MKLIWHRLQKAWTGSFLENLWMEVNRKDLTIRAGSLALFSVMSVFPFIALIVWVSTLSGSLAEANHLVERFSIFLPSDIEMLVRTEVDYRLEQEQAGIGFSAYFHVGLFIFSAGGALRAFLFSLRQIARADESISALQIVWRSFFFIFPTIAFVFIASMLVGIFSFIGRALFFMIDFEWLSHGLLWLCMTGTLIVVLNAVYASSFVGHQIVRIHGWLGAAWAAGLVSIITILIGYFFDLSSMNQERYGSTSFIIDVLLWFYLCSVSVLLGAEINAVRNIRLRRAQAINVRRGLMTG